MSYQVQNSSIYLFGSLNAALNSSTASSFDRKEKHYFLLHIQFCFCRSLKADVDQLSLLQIENQTKINSHKPLLLEIGSESILSIDL